MPGAPKPVTLGDLRVLASPPPNPYRKATVADLVSALRVEGVLVVERVDGEWPNGAIEVLARIIHLKDPSYMETNWDDCTPETQTWYRATACGGLDALLVAFDPVPYERARKALAEAQPFPPAGG